MCTRVHACVYTYLLGIIQMEVVEQGAKRPVAPQRRRAGPRKGEDRLWASAIKGWERPTGVVVVELELGLEQ